MNTVSYTHLDVYKRQIFTHVEWHMNGYYIELENQPEELTFVSPSALRADCLLYTSRCV